MVFRRTPKYVVERTPQGYVINLQGEELDLVVRLFAELRGRTTMVLGVEECSSRCEAMS